MTEQFFEKAKNCKTAEELKALAEKENVELTDDELNDIDGGVISVFGKMYLFNFSNNTSQNSDYKGK